MKFLSLLPLTVALADRDDGDAFRPVENVVNLLREMSATLKKEQEDDDKLWEKTECWCRVNKKQKNAAIAKEKANIAAFENEIATQEGAIRSLTLKIADHEKMIKEAEETIAKATELRKKENEHFLSEKADFEQTIASLTDALKVLNGHHAESELATSLLQLRKNNKFSDKMHKDLWTMLGQTQIAPEAIVNTGGFLQAQEEPRVYDADEELKAPNEVKGAHGGVKSYNNRSGAIVGIMKQMHDKFSNDLETAIRDENNAQAAFEDLTATKRDEIFKLDTVLNKNEHNPSLRTKLGTAKRLKGEAEAKLALEQEALAADEEFLANVVEKCTAAEKAYNGRTAERTDEKNTVDKVIGMLNGPEFRAQFQKTTFVQLTKQTRSNAAIVNALLRAARSHHNQPLTMLALQASAGRFKGDVMQTIKDAIKDMIADLKAEATGDVQKRQKCLADLDKNKSDTFDRNLDLKAANNKIALCDTKILKAEKAIKELQESIDETKQSIQVGGFDRAEENKEFQTSVHDQKLTISMLQQAMEVLEAFYKNRAESEKKAFITGEPENRPGMGTDRPPTATEGNVAYKPSAGAEGVMILLENIIGNANKMIADLSAEEQEAQKSYETFVADSNTVLQAARDSRAEKKAEIAGLNSEKTAAQGEADVANTAINGLDEQKKGLHTTCDFLLNNYDNRMSARDEEIEGLQQALGILSGAEFQNLTLT